MMRRLLGLTLLLGLALPLSARAQTITVAPGGEMSSLVGVPFDVPLYVDMSLRPERLGSFALRMTWDPTVLKFTGGSDGTFGSVIANEDSLKLGVLRLTGANPAGVGGLVTLGVAHFLPLAALSDTLRLSVSELYAAGTFADLTPSMMVRGATFCPARGMYGDIDKDGAINSRDALIALSNAVGIDVSAFDITLGDVDANGATNARDALIILTYSVGLPTTGFRVDRIAGGSCAANLPLVMAILPDTVDLLVGQTVAFEARAADSTGVLKTITNALWSSGNSGKLAMYSDGTALARDTGLVWVTAVRGTLDSAQALVRIGSRRTHHYVDAAAAGARNQLGSAAFPFGTIGQGTRFASSGDTVEVRAGRYPEAVTVSQSLVLLGDTLADGTRPLIVVDTNAIGTGITLGGGAVEVHNFAVDGYYDGVDVAGAQSALLEGLRITNAAIGVAVVDTAELVHIRGSRLTGGVSRYGNGIETEVGTGTLVVEGTEISDFAYDGIYASYADSVVLLRSHIHDVGEYGIYAYVPTGGCEVSCEVVSFGKGLLVQPMVALVVDSSTIESASDWNLINLENFRSAVVTHSRLLAGASGYGVYLYSNVLGSWARFVGDSIDARYEWMDAENLDSLTVDSSAVTMGSGEGYAYHIPAIRLTRTRIAMQNGGEALYVYNYGTGGRVTLDSVAVTGDPSCDLCGTGFEVYYATLAANRVAATNLSDGIYSDGTDSSLTVTNSTFRHVYYAIGWYGSAADSTRTVAVSGSLFDGFSEAINTSGFAFQVDSNVFRGGSDLGAYVGATGGPVAITRNQFTSVWYPIEGYRSAASSAYTDSITDNVMTDVSSVGIYFNEDSLIPLHILRNQVACNTSGYNGIVLDYGDGLIANNQVQGCSYGINVDAFTQRHADTIAGNTITTPAQYYYGGIFLSGRSASLVARNTVAGPATAGSGYGSIYVDGGIALAGFTRVTNNTVQNGSFAGINFSALDSAFVDSNTVQGVNGAGIYVGGALAYKARIYGNAVRNVAGNGIYIQNNDSAMVKVDSNAVTGSAQYGIYLSQGVDSVSRTRVTGSGIAGLYINSYLDTTRIAIHNSFIAGNKFGLNAQYPYAYHAENNWWGNAAGPSCYASDTACTMPGGDSVTAGLHFKPFLTDTSTLTGVPAAPPMRAIAARAPILPATGEAVHMVPLRSGPVRVTDQAPPPRIATRRTADRPPAGLSPARRQAWERMQQQRAAEASAMAQREARMATERAARVTARQARVQQLEQERAAREARRKAQETRAASAHRGERS